MNDLSICKRIAEIEDLAIDGENLTSVNVRVYNQGLDIPVIVMYNPLTDDALCFQLMVKYKLEFFPVGEFYHCAWSDSNVTTFDKNANKAICLAIIEAHKEQ